MKCTCGDPTCKVGQRLRSKDERLRAVIQENGQLMALIEEQKFTQTVAVITAGMDYEGYDILHVTATLDQAYAWQNAYQADRKNRPYDNWRIEEWNVTGSNC